MAKRRKRYRLLLVTSTKPFNNYFPDENYFMAPTCMRETYLYEKRERKRDKERGAGRERGDKIARETFFD